MSSHSQAGQDIFAQYVVDNNNKLVITEEGKKSEIVETKHILPIKTFLELGAGQPVYISNTKTLDDLGWQGVSVDISSQYSGLWPMHRKTPLVIADTCNMQWDAFFDQHPSLLSKSYIDYLSFDVDEGTDMTITSFPWTTVRFRCATVEHDLYRQGPASQNLIRKTLEDAGYTRVFSNVSVPFNVGAHPFLEVNADRTLSFEDWWVDLSLLDAEHPLRTNPLLMKERLLWSDIVASF